MATHQSVFLCARLCLVPTPESGDEYFEDDIIKTNNKVTIEYCVPVKKSWEEMRLVEVKHEEQWVGGPDWVERCWRDPTQV